MSPTATRDALMKRLGRIETQGPREFPWRWALVAFVISATLSVAILLILSAAKIIPDYWFVVIPVLFTIIGQLVPLLQWILPSSAQVGAIPAPQVLPSPQRNQGQADTWNLPYRQNPFFTGRRQLLESLHANFKMTNTSTLTQTLSGLGGIGKTQIAVEYAYRYHNEYPHIFWFVAANRETLVQGFLEVARLLSLRERKDKDHNIVVQAVRQWLEQQKKWLLIFDNADDLQLTETFIPTGGGGHILVTTRAQATGTLATTVNIEKMDSDEGALFLLRRSKILASNEPIAHASVADRSVAAEISGEMDGLPLALDQAGAYLEETQCNLSQYLTSYHRRRTEMLNRRGGTDNDHPDPVGTTWSLSFERIERMDDAAADLLRAVAFLAADSIPEELLIRGASELGRNLKQLVNDPARINEPIAVLLRYSLVKRDPAKSTITIHRLVQFAVRNSMDRRTERKWAERIVKATSLAFPDDVTDVALWSECDRLLPHAMACSTLIETYDFRFDQASSLLNNVAHYLDLRALYPPAEPLYQRALRIRESELGPDHSLTTTTMNNLARLYRDMGKYDLAEDLYRQALAARERALGPLHPDTATSLNNLGRLLYVQGRYSDAKPYLNRALAIRKQKLPPDDREIAESLHNLANLYYRESRYDEALPLYEHALEIRERQLGPENLITTISIMDRARLHHASGNYREADQLFDRAAAIRRKHFPDHPELAIVLYRWGSLCETQGKYSEAEAKYKEALHIWEKGVVPDHPDVAFALTGLGDVREAVGQHDEAERLYRRALAIREAYLDADHPDTAVTLSRLASLLEAQGKLTEASSLYGRAVAIRELRLGVDHPDTLAVRNSHARLLEAMGKPGDPSRPAQP